MPLWLETTAFSRAGAESFFERLRVTNVTSHRFGFGIRFIHAVFGMDIGFYVSGCNTVL